MRSRWVMGSGPRLDGVAVAVCIGAPLHSGADGSSTLLEANGGGALVPPALFPGFGRAARLAPWRAARVVARTTHGAVNGLAILSMGAVFLLARLASVVGLAVDLRASVRTGPRPAATSA